MIEHAPYVLFRDDSENRTTVFAEPLRVITARTRAEFHRGLAKSRRPIVPANGSRASWPTKRAIFSRRNCPLRAGEPGNAADVLRRLRRAGKGPSACGAAAAHRKRAPPRGASCRLGFSCLSPALRNAAPASAPGRLLPGQPDHADPCALVRRSARRILVVDRASAGEIRRARRPRRPGPDLALAGTFLPGRRRRLDRDASDEGHGAARRQP